MGCSATRTRLPSRPFAHFHIELFLSVIATVVKKRGAAVGLNVDELTPEIESFAVLQRGFGNVLYPLNRLRGKVPAAHRPFFIAPGKPAQARRRFLGPDSLVSGIRRGG